MISFESVSKTFGNQTVLTNVTFQVAPGRITAIVGPNGSGKSTLLRGLLGLISFDSGHATLDLKVYRDLLYPMRTVGAFIESNLGSSGRTSWQFLRILAISQGLPKARVAEVLSLVGLEAASHKRVGTLSLGMRQRLGIAMALLANPKYLVFDEPLNGLDQDGIVWFRDLLSKLASSGTGVIIASHNLSEVERIAHEVIFLGRGQVLGQIQMDELRELRWLLVANAEANFDEILSTAGEKILTLGNRRFIPSRHLDFWLKHVAAREDNTFQVQQVGDVMETVYEGILSTQVDHIGKGTD